MFEEVEGVMPSIAEKRKLNIAFDFDDTISEDPETWFKVMCLLDKAGHWVKVVTARPELPDVDCANLDIKAFLAGSSFEVIYCSGVQKADVCERLGWPVDVFIDDMPEVCAKRTALYGRVEEMGLI